MATHVSLALLVQLAYGVDKSQIAHQPGWFDTASTTSPPNRKREFG